MSPSGRSSGCSRLYPRSHRLVTPRRPGRRTWWQHGWLQAGLAKHSHELTCPGVCTLGCSRYLKHHKPATLPFLFHKVRKKPTAWFFSLLLSFSRCSNNFCFTSCSGSPVERRWSCAALPYPNLLGDNWMQQEIRRMGFDLAKGEGFLHWRVDAKMYSCTQQQ